MNNHLTDSKLVESRPYLPAWTERHHRITGGLWFGLWAAFTVGAIPLTIFFLFPGREIFFVFLSIVFSAAVVGAAYGYRLLDDEHTASKQEASAVGLKATAMIHFVWMLAIAAWGALFWQTWPNINILEILVQLFACFLFSLLFPGIFTFPLGAIGAKWLFELRTRRIAATGCRIHGYGRDSRGTTDGASEGAV